MIPDNVETIIMTKEDYDRNVEQLLIDKIKAEQEVERLNNIIKTKDEGIKAFTEDLCETTKELEKVNYIINELEKYIEFMLKEFNYPEEVYTLKQIERILNKLQELKGDSSNDKSNN